eukprot:3779486-Ditylum_brightwellii.AAC.1
MEQVAPESTLNTLHLMYVWRMLLAYTFGEYKAVVDIADKSRVSIKECRQSKAQEGHKNIHDEDETLGC